MSGVWVRSRQAIIELTQTDLPDPVAPAMSEMGHARQVGGHDLALHILAQGDAQAALHLHEALALHEFLQPHDIGRLVRHFHPNVVGARDGGLDAHAGRGQRQGKVVGQTCDLGYFDLDSLILGADFALDIAGFDQVLGDRGTFVGAFEFGGYAKEGQGFLDQTPLLADDFVAVGDPFPVTEDDGEGRQLPFLAAAHDARVEHFVARGRLW